MKASSENLKIFPAEMHLLTAIITTFLWFTPHTVQAADLGNIMPMGDSITYGVPVAGGYRDPLYTLLTNRSDTFTFVGSSTGNATTALTAAGQAHHEGHSGFVITNGVGRAGLDEHLAGWIGPGGEDPDKILLMIGTNDIDLDNDLDNAPARLNALINHIYDYKPNVTVYLASIVPIDNTAKNVKVETFNAAIPDIVASQRALGRTVIYVPMYEALDVDTDLSDSLHPNAGGYQKMAAAWDTALHSSYGINAVDVITDGNGPGLGSNYSAGWDFTLSHTIEVIALGQFDPDSNPTSNTVAIYQRGGAKIAETSVLTNSPAEYSGNFSARYVPIASTVLAPGNYVVFSTQNGNNFIAPDGSPDATLGSVLTWNFGVAVSGAAGPIPATAPPSWQIENSGSYRYIGPTFKYKLVSSGIFLNHPADNEVFTGDESISATATVENATGSYTVHIYTNSASGPFAEAGTGGSSSPYSVDFGTLPDGAYNIYATVTDDTGTTTTSTNTFEFVSGIHAVDITNTDGGSGLGDSYSVGWDFTVKRRIAVTSLGQFDPAGDATSNSVAIYQRGGTKLVEASVLTTSLVEPSGVYSARYEPITATELVPGNYVIFSTQNGNNFIAPGGTPATTMGSAITWNKGLAVSGAAGPLPVTAPPSWQIENSDPSRYFGPTFKYEELEIQINLTSPQDNRVFSIAEPISATVIVANSTGAYTAHIYTKSASGSFSEAGSGSSSSPYSVDLVNLSVGTYNIYASVTDEYGTTVTPTNTFTVVALPTGQQTLNLTGWNHDIIIGKDEASPEYTASMASWNFYEYGLSGGSQGLPADAEGTNRTFTSSYNSSVQFQFAPYDESNCAYLDGLGNTTLTLEIPGRFYSLQFLMTTRTTSWHATLNFADGSSTDTPTWSDPDWTSSGPSDRCLISYGLKGTSGSFYSGYLWMAQRDYTLTAEDSDKTLTSITFTTNNSSQLALFAVSGYVHDSEGDQIPEGTQIILM